MEIKVQRTVEATVKLDDAEVSNLVHILDRFRGNGEIMEWARKLARELRAASKDAFDEDEEDF